MDSRSAGASDDGIARDKPFAPSHWSPAGSIYLQMADGLKVLANARWQLARSREVTNRSRQVVAGSRRTIQRAQVLRAERDARRGIVKSAKLRVA